MTTEYLGNETTKYIFDTGNIITLINTELEELISENNIVTELRKKVAEIEDEAKELSRENSRLESSNYRLNRDKQDLEIEIRKIKRDTTDNMTLEQFNTIAWTGGMQVEYLSNIYDVVSVDFEAKILWIEGDTEHFPISYSQCKLVDGGVYEINGSLGDLKV